MSLRAQRPHHAASSQVVPRDVNRPHRPRAPRLIVRAVGATVLGSMCVLALALPVSAAPHAPQRPASHGRALTVASILSPSTNISPQPNFVASGPCTKPSGQWSCQNPCVTPQLVWPTSSNQPACTAYIVSAINRARALENLRPLVLPQNWYHLTTREQLFVMADLERTARGLAPYLGLNGALNAAAQLASRHNADPSLAPGFAVATNAQGLAGFGGAWSGGFSVLAADYYWMYDDGWGGSAALTSNVVCTSPGAAGCWSHRDELLGSDPNYNLGVGLGCATCEMGTGYSLINGSGSYVDLIESSKGRPPAMVFTWARNVVPYL